ncbi:uncharacterized protein LOC5503674 [Nematostella vectensis]|uniref:uncharacterized protein LOC5503674 n=1 Tax=Nematostella vectensis TaxID=45351 RepID=UPI00138FF12C|nr:uncharacterized protein LOC5503674 [Nematostella vectensis]
MTECAECQKRIPRALLERHSQYECFQRMVQCVLCTENVKRDGLNLHLTNCEERSRTCGVPGCHFHGNKEQMLRHRVSYASGHVELYRTYAKRLAHAIAKKSTPSVEKLPLRVETFLWCTEAFKEKAASARAGQPLTSPTYRSEAGEKWRLVLFVKPYKLYAQLQSSVAPLNVNIRLILLDDADENRDQIFTADGLLIKEGQMFGKRRSLKDLETYVEGPQKTLKN